MKNTRIPFKNKEAECIFTHIYNDDLSLVIDIIRHYKRIVFRGFAVIEHEKRDFSRLFPFPAGDDPFSGDAGGDRVKMDISRNLIEGDFRGEPPISFDLSFAIEDYYFNTTRPGWIEKVGFLNRLYEHLDLTKAVSLLQEDFPLTKFDGNVKFGGKDYPLNQANGVILHHWGWHFPDYLFLACNGFPEPETLLTLAFVESITSGGIGITSGYLYLHHRGSEKKLISPVQGKIIHFSEGGKISLIARSGEKRYVRVNIDPKRGAAFPHVFNTRSVTVLNAGCEVEGVGSSDKAVLDVKGIMGSGLEL